MFDGVGDDFDLKYAASLSQQQRSSSADLAALPTAVGRNAITRQNSVPEPSPRGTTASRSRTALRDYQKEATPATQKDIEDLRHAVRRLETKIQGLDSRVQYVNPWAVQHMWNVLLKLQQRVGVSDEHLPGTSWGAAGSSTPFGRHHASAAEDDTRSCSPLTPKHGPHLSVTLSAMDETMRSAAVCVAAQTALPASPHVWNLPVGVATLQLEESLVRQQVLIDACTEWHSIAMQRTADLEQRSGLERSAIAHTMMIMEQQQVHTQMRATSSQGEEAFPTTSLSPASIPRNRTFATSDASPLSPLSPNEHTSPLRVKLRSQFVSSIIHDDAFTDRLKFLLADFAQPLMEATQKRFIQDAERWMQAHTANLQHESHEFTKEMAAKWGTIQSALEHQRTVSQEQLETMLAEARRTTHDDATTVVRLREEIQNMTSTMALRLAQLDGWRDDLVAQMEDATERRLASLINTFRRIGEQQDVMQRRLDDIQSRQLLQHDAHLTATSDNDATGDEVATDGTHMAKALAYLDGLLLAPSTVRAVSGSHELHTANTSSVSSRLEDSVLLVELHAALTKLSQLLTSASASAAGVVAGTHHHVIHHSGTVVQLLGSTLKDLPLRPVNLFPVDTVVTVIVPLLLRHSMFALRSECARLKLPLSIQRGLEGVWRWMTEVSLGVVWRRTIREAEQETFNVAEEEAVLKHRLLLTQDHRRSRSTSCDSLSSRAYSMESRDTFQRRSKSPQPQIAPRDDRTAGAHHSRPAHSQRQVLQVESILTDDAPRTTHHADEVVSRLPAATTFYGGNSNPHSTAHRRSADVAVEPRRSSQPTDFSYLYDTQRPAAGNSAARSSHASTARTSWQGTSTRRGRDREPPPSSHQRSSSRTNTPLGFGPVRLAFR